MDEALRLREAVTSAVCSKEYSRLAGLVQQLAKLAPTEEVLRESGIGHLVGDRHVWLLAGHIVQRRAAALAGKWRTAFRRAQSSGTATPRGTKVQKPFGGLGAKAFMAIVYDFEQEISSTSPALDKATRRMTSRTSSRRLV